MFKRKLRSLFKIRRRAKSNRCGTVSVEMALVAPVIFVMVFGSVEFARMMMIRQALTNAARAGCRKACLVTTQTSSQTDDAVRESLRGVIKNADVTKSIRIQIEPDFSTIPESGETVRTYVEVDCADVSWLPPFFTSAVKISGSASMRRE